MWVLPFLVYYHAYPLTSFYNEWLAVLLGLCAACWLPAEVRSGEPVLPRIALLPLALLVVLLLQVALGRVEYAGQTLLYAAYWLWAAVLMALGHRLRERLGLGRLALMLSAFLLVGAELSALAGLVQQYQWDVLLRQYVTVKTSSAVYGNLAQPNHYADYTGLGLVSLALLLVRGKLRVWQAVLLAVPLLFVLTLSGSRTSWIFLLALTAMSLVYWKRDRAMLPFLQFSCGMLIGFAVMHGVVQLPWLAGTEEVTAWERLFNDAGSGGIRLILWREALMVFAQYPVFGAGFGQFAWQHFQLGPILQNPQIAGLYNNAHNTLLQLAAEGGLASLLPALALAALWWRGSRRLPMRPERWWGYAVLLVLLTHSLLEYPLWYAYFLGIAAFMLGALETRAWRIPARNLSTVGSAFVLLAAIFVAGLFLRDYRALEQTYAASTTTSDRAKLQAAYAHFGEIGRNVLLTPYTDLFMNSMLGRDLHGWETRQRWNEKVLHFVPLASSAYRQSLLWAQNGKAALAGQCMAQAIWAYPDDFPAVWNELEALARKDPDRYAALLKSAVQINEERQRAVRIR
ncbi:MAG: Wzy polymerase domain-containing protein [Pseudomonadota bacterium]